MPAKAGIQEVSQNWISPRGDKPAFAGMTNLAFGPHIPNRLISAVPEPSAVFMLLAGLGLVGFVAKRRQPETAGV